MHNIIQYLRNIRRNKVSFLINLISLSSGLASILFIYLWVNDEISMDKFHENGNRLYQVLIRHQSSSGPKVAEMIPGVMADDLTEKIPEIEHAVAVVNSIRLNTISTNEKAIKAKGIYAGEDLLKIFSFDLLDGFKESLLKDENSIVISEELGLKLFGTTRNLIGKPIEFDKDEQFIISGVVTVPAKSSIQFDFILLLQAYEKHTGFQISWDEMNAYTYIVLNKNSNVDHLNSKLAAYLKDIGGDPEKVEVFSRKFSDGYLFGKYENGVQSGGRIEYVKIFSIIGFIILLIACINFVNLSTALASARVKEVGIKKVLGADRKSIIAQHLGESITLAFLALSLSILLVISLLPSFNGLTGKQIEMNWSFDRIIALFSITLFTGLLAGIYPAFYISGFQPLSILKDNFSYKLSGQWLRKTLIIIQFSISVILIITTLVIYEQFKMIQNRNLGYNKDNILYFDMDGEVLKHRQAFLSELNKLPGVLKASSVYSLTESSFLGGDFGSTGQLNWPGKAPDETVIMNYRMVDYDAMELLDLEMKEGRTFSRKFSDDSFKIIFNEAAIKAMGLENPIGTNIELWNDKFEILGVVKDFYFESIHSGSVKPMFIVLGPTYGRLNTVMVKVDSQGLDKTINAIQEFHSQFNPGFPFSYKFLDQDFQKQYTSELKLSVLSRYFAGISILIACLGVFGLTAFTVNKRKKEICIRKVLGSNDWQTILLLYKDVSKLVLIALLIGFPVGYVLNQNWLNGFALRIDLEPWYFILAGGVSFGLMLIFSGIQIVKILLINPAESLRAE